ncbi:MAG: CHAT domain-containing protein [Cyanobacteria bacterium]|nr:CHAT domain-containing protein [Cyanobacteriota bacterium]MDW8200507.1 CHAT domain-containing protein [Cyanobacteriota bacterium SKYGB_h_bin112]
MLSYVLVPASCWLVACPALAQPVIPASDGTGTIVTSNDNQFTITGGAQVGANLFHSFQQFGLDANQTATFLATPDLHNILSRVVGGYPSVINGLLQVTGGNPNLYLMNPAGIIFGPNASLDVPASFTATTATSIGFGEWRHGGMGAWFPAYGTTNYSTLLGNPTSFLVSSPAYPFTPSSIVNAGNLAVASGQSLSLVGGLVMNTGTLSAPGGTVSVLSVPNSSLVRISQPGSLLSLEIDPTQIGSGVVSTSLVSLPELLTSSGFSSQATGLTVNADGTVRLTASNTIVPQQAGTTIISGAINVSQSPPLGSLLSSGQGGTVQVSGNQVGLLSATINASGEHSGGTVLVGGGFQGNGQVPNALYSYGDTKTTIHADALNTGSGGNVVIWADNTTSFFGTITARGGSIAGDGGFVEVSGKRSLTFAGQVDTQATNGQAGTLLLDPTDINIVNGCFPAGNAADGLWAITEDVGTQSIGTEYIAAILLTTDLILEASNNITWDVGVFLDYDGIPARTLTLRANNTITFSGTIQDGNLVTPNQLNVTFNADRDGNGAGAIVLNGGNISTNGGNILLSGGTDPTTGFAAGEAITPSATSGILLTNGARLNSRSGSITLRGTSPLSGIGTSGIDIQGASTQISTGAGTITLVGSNTNPNSTAPAIVLGFGSQLSSGTGSISLVGTSAAQSNGIEIQGTASSASGTITLVGANDNSSGRTGILVSGTVRADNISLRGTTAGEGVFARGVEIGVAGQVAFSELGGQITISGNTNSTSSDSAAILMLGTIDASDGNVTFLAKSNPGVRGISMTSDNPQITARSINAISTQDIVITALDLTTSGGDITLTSTDGNVTTGNIATQGGALTIQANTSITTEAIDTSSTGGRGGNVTLDPSGDIQVTYINAQGGLRSAGGTIEITTNRFFRATGSFTDQNSTIASISTAGGGSGGSITIRHAGGSTTPFVVGQSSSNGTVAAITSGATNTIASGTFPQTYTQGNISLITTGLLPPETISLSTTEDNSPNQYETTKQPVVENDVQFPIFESAPQALQRLQRSTGKTPAIIYVSFLPSLATSASGSSNTSATDANLPAAEDKFRADFSFLEADRSKPQTPAAMDATPQPKSLPADTAVGVNWLFNQQTLPSLQSLRSLSTAQTPPTSTNDLLELVMVTPTGKPVRIRSSVNRGQVNEMVLLLRGSITDSSSDDYLAPAQQLYQWLVAPLKDELQRRKIDTLVFSMDEGLRTLPIAALHDGKNYLIQDYSLALTPSFNLTDTRYQDIKRLQVLGMGASTFREFNPLPAVPIELQVVETFWRGRTFLNQGFTRANLIAERNNIPFGIVHLATHAQFSADEAFIQFWDTRLQTNQMRQLGLNNPPVELLILSACRTAIGDRNTELGFAGLAVQAGVKSVLASLWYVSDEGTMTLMSEFYRELAHPEVTIKAEALRRAQLAMISGKGRPEDGKLVSNRGIVELPPDLAQRMATTDLSHPYYWAGFTMVGSPW